MPDSPPPRRYDEDEVRRILERATELQRELPAATAPEGLTLDELEEAAAEAGIERPLIRRAARELDTAAEESGPWTALAGAPLTIVLERTLPGEVSTDVFGDLAAEIERSLGIHGEPTVLGHTLSWRAESAGTTRFVHVMVTTRDGETHIRVGERLQGLAGGVFGGLVGGAGGGLGLGVGVAIGLGALESAFFAVAWPAGVVSLSYVAAREIFGVVARKRRRALSDLLERITLMIGPPDSGAARRGPSH